METNRSIGTSVLWCAKVYDEREEESFEFE
jgi:hypothetical protein